MSRDLVLGTEPRVHPLSESMSTPLSALEAYRSDLERYRGRDRVSQNDGLWILTAGVVEQLSETLSDERSSLARNFGTEILALAADQQVPSPLCDLATLLQSGLTNALTPVVFDAVLDVAEHMERDGVLQLPFSMLAHLRRAFPESDARRQGRSVAIQARIAREMGDLEGALDLYKRVAGIAADASMDDVAAEAAHGLGGVALARGNLPHARMQYEIALRAARSMGATTLEGRAHRGLLIVAAKEGNYDAALQHGWAAFERSLLDSSQQAELLGNLGGLLRETGHFSTSFACYALALQLSDADRIRLPALGGAALSAALDDEPERVAVLAALIEAEMQSGAQPFNAAQVLLDLATAYQAIGSSKVVETAQRAKRISAQYEYFELEYQSEQLLHRAMKDSPHDTRAPLELSEASSKVMNSVTALAYQRSSVSALIGTKG